MTDKTLLYVVNHMDWFWSHRLPLAKGAQNDGWNVIVAAPGAADDERLGDYGFRGVDLPPRGVMGQIAALRGIFGRERPDLIHAITIKYAFITGLAAAFIRGLNIVHTLAGLGYFFSSEGMKPRLLRLFIGPVLKFALKQADARIIFQNPDDQALMICRGFVRQSHTHLIKGSGVDVDAFAYVPEPQVDVPLVVMPTRLVHDKGVGVFIEAVRILKNKGVDADFQIAGGEAPHNPLGISKTEMEEMTKDGCAAWLGKVDDMADLYARANMIVYPSYYGEGIPKVLLEACATGRAIVTTDHPGCREAVEHGKNGFLVPIKDAAATALAIEDLLKDHAKRADMGQYSRKRAEQEFNADLIVRQTLDVYRIYSHSI